MKIAGTPYRSIWLAPHGIVRVIDQRRLPFEFATLDLATLADAAHAIADMAVRGAPLIGATAAYGLALALRADPSDAGLAHGERTLLATRPTAVNLAWALAEVRRAVAGLAPDLRAAVALEEATRLCEEDVATCQAIGRHGLGILQELAPARARPLNILTHCNAGWLACVDWGTALAPIYLAHDAGIAVRVWVDETRPRNQGASLTAFELGAHGVPYTLIADNAGGELMRRGEVDLVIVGSDRTTAAGDVCNKVGTYLKALAAHDNGVPFYVALPLSTFDWSIEDGRRIVIEERAAEEVTHVRGQTEAGALATVRIAPPGAAARNLAFDVTPARLVTGLITERGILAATRAALAPLRPAAGSGR